MLKGLSKQVRKIIRRVIAFILMGVILLVLIILKKNSPFCELYTKKIGRAYQSILGPLVALIPFSLMEVLAVVCISLVFIFLIGSIKNFIKIRPAKAVVKLLNLVNLATFIVLIYMGTAEIPYNRMDLKVNYYTENVERSEFTTIINHFVDDINYCCSQLKFKEDGELDVSYSTKELSDICAKEYEKLKDNSYFTEFTTTCKPMLSSFLYREFHITGVTFLPTTEANVNTLNVEGGKPFTFLHELAHSKGVMREDDAQKVAMCLSLTSSNPYLRFSGYYYTFSSLLDLARHTGVATDYNDIYKTIDSRFLNYYSFANKYWNDHDLLNDFADWWNNLYLKTSGVKEGTQSYQDTKPDYREDIVVFSSYQKIYFSIYYGKELL